MHVPINVKSPNNISEWQMGFNSVFKGLITSVVHWQKLSVTSYVQTGKRMPTKQI
jgi:hypothetical protein